MSHRLAKGGRLINRAHEQKFTFNGKPMRGLKGDTLAAAIGVPPAFEMHAARILAIEHVGFVIRVRRSGAKARQMRLAAGGEFGCLGCHAAAGADQN